MANGTATLKKVSSPGAAAAGYTSLYFDTNGNLHIIQDDGTDTTIGSATLAALLDILISSPASGQVLTYNGTVWVNQTLPTSSGKNYATRHYSQATFS